MQSNLLAKDRLPKLFISSFLLLRTHERLGGLGADIGTGTEHSLGLFRHLRVREVRVLETGGIEDRGREVRPGEVGALELGAQEQRVLETGSLQIGPTEVRVLETRPVEPRAP